MPKTILNQALSSIRVGEDRASLILSTPCQHAQLMVTLRKGEDQWLSPMGWSHSEKATLLDCQPFGDGACLFIPEAHAANFQDGDAVHVRCTELGLDATLVWPSALGQSPVETRNVPQLALDSAKEALEADLAAQALRAQMAAAKNAQLEAQRRAEDAQRAAEAARKAEEEGRLEMERAEKALAEAEARREVERARAEALARETAKRAAEDARRAEEARQLEAARRRQAERAAERARIEQELAGLTLRRKDTETTLITLREQLARAKDEASQFEAQLARLDMQHSEAALDAEQTEARLAQAQAELKALTERRQAAMRSFDHIKTETEALASPLSKAEQAFHKADKAAEEAIARANAARRALNELEDKRAKLFERADAAKDDDARILRELTTAQAAVEDKAGDAAQMRRREQDLAQNRAAVAKDGEESFTQSAQALTRLENAQNELTFMAERKTAAQNALGLLEDGADLSEVRAALGEGEGQQARSSGENLAAVAKQQQHAAPAPRHSRRRRFGARMVTPSGASVSAAPASASPVITVATAEKSARAAVKQAALARGPMLSAPMALRAGAMKLQVPPARLLAGVAAVALAGVMGYALTHNNPSTEARGAQITQATPVKTQVLSTTAIVKDDAAPVLPDLEIAPAEPAITAAKAPVQSAEIVAPPSDAAPVEAVDYQRIFESEMPKIVPAKLAALVKPAAETAVTPEPKRPESSAAKPETEVKKEAANKPKAEDKAPAQTTPALTAVLERSAEVKPAPVTPVIVTALEDTGPSAALIGTVQNKLSDLGFYRGAKSTKMDGATVAAIHEFKTLFGLPKDDEISASFLTMLDQAVRDVAASRQAALAAPKAAQPIAVTLSDPALLASPQSIATPDLAQVTPEPVKLAAIASSPKSAPKPEPVKAPVIVEAKRLNSLTGEYPARALNRGFEQTVEVLLTYDITETGKPANVIVDSVKTGGENYDGIYRSSFEEAGRKSIGLLDFQPKTIDARPVMTIGQTQKIVFRVE